MPDAGGAPRLGGEGAMGMLDHKADYGDWGPVRPPDPPKRAFAIVLTVT